MAQGAGRTVRQDLERALARASEIGVVGIGALQLDAFVPQRRLVDLARYGMAAKAPQLRRHSPSRRLATLAYLEAKSIDDVLELFDLLMVTELLGKAERQATKEKVRQHPNWFGPRPSWLLPLRCCSKRPARARRCGSRNCGR